MITEPILGLMAGIAMAFIPFGAMGAAIAAPELPRRYPALVTGAWGVAHGLVFLWAQATFGPGDAVSIYAWFGACVGLVAALLILVWPR